MLHRAIFSGAALLVQRWTRNRERGSVAKMWAWVLLALANSEPQTVRLSPRSPLDVVFISPVRQAQGEGGGGLVSAFFRKLDESLAPATPLTVKDMGEPCTADPNGLVALDCLVLEARPDFERAGGLSNPDAEAVWRALQTQASPLLLSFTLVPKDQLEIIVKLIDTDAALRAIHTNHHGPLSGTDRIFALNEALLADDVALVNDTLTGSAETLEKMIETLVQQMLRKPLEQRGLWQPTVQFEIRSNPANAKVQVDNQVLNLGGAWRIEDGVLGRTYQVRAEAQGYQSNQQAFTLSAAGQKLELKLFQPQVSILKRYDFWTGVGLTAAGGVLGAIASTQKTAPMVCAPGTEKCPAGFESALAPVAIGLSGAGLTVLIWSLIEDRVDHGDWVKIAVGLGVGAVLGGASFLIVGVAEP